MIVIYPSTLLKQVVDYIPMIVVYILFLVVHPNSQPLSLYYANSLVVYSPWLYGLQRQPLSSPSFLREAQGWPRLELVVRGADAHGRHRLAGVAVGRGVPRASPIKGTFKGERGQELTGGFEPNASYH